MVSVMNQPLRQIGAPPMQQKAIPEVPILANAVLLIVERGSAIWQLAPEHHARVNEGVPKGKRPANALIAQGRVDHASGFPHLVDDPAIDADDNHRRVGYDGFPLFSQAIRPGEIIGVLPRNPASPGEAKPLVEASRLAFIHRVGDQPNAGIPLGPAFGDFHRMVGGRIIDDEKLKIAEALIENALNGGIQIRPRIKGRS